MVVVAVVVYMCNYTGTRVRAVVQVVQVVVAVGKCAVACCVHLCMFACVPMLQKGRSSECHDARACVRARVCMVW